MKIGGEMMGGVAFLIAVIGIFALAIGWVEWMDRREEARHKKILEKSVRCTGIVKRVERRGISEGGSPYVWRAVVEFEYENRNYNITQKCTSKPWCGEGDRVTVLVDADDPDDSFAMIE